MSAYDMMDSLMDTLATTYLVEVMDRLTKYTGMLLYGIKFYGTDCDWPLVWCTWKTGREGKDIWMTLSMVHMKDWIREVKDMDP